MAGGEIFEELMSLKDQMAADALSVFCNPNEVADPVLYVAADGTTTSVNAVISQEPTGATLGADGQYIEADATALVSMLKEGGVVSPEIEDVVLVAGETYAVIKVQKNSCDSTAMLTLKRKDMKRAAARTGFRQ